MISLLECIGLIEEILGRTADVRFETERFGDLRYFVTDTTKFHNAAAWEPRTVPDKGVVQLIDWLKAHPDLFAV